MKYITKSLAWVESTPITPDDFVPAGLTILLVNTKDTCSEASDQGMLSM